MLVTKGRLEHVTKSKWDWEKVAQISSFYNVKEKNKQPNPACV